MATKTDPAAARAKKQKILLIGASAVFLLLALVQGPKLWKQINPPAPEAAAPAPAGVTGASATTAAGTTVTATTTTVATGQSPSGAATLTTVSVSPRPSVEDGQLAAFTLFEAKDPFEQQVSADTGAGAPAAAPLSTGPAPEAIASGSNAPTATGGRPEKPKAVAPTFATIQVDGKPSQLQLKEAFPQPDKLFVLVSLKKSKAKIGVKGGSFADGDLVQLTLDKPVTLMNTTTGSRYVVKLVYTGTQPENIEGFSQPAAAAASDAPAASGAPSATSGAPTATSGTDTAASGNG